MPITLSPLLQSYVSSMNAHDSAAFINLFASDAVVHDEGHEHRGTAAIKSWIEEAWDKYQPTLEARRVTEKNHETILTGLVSGTFDGSPVELHHQITVADGKIAALKITA
jgi:hypothetical protein